MATHVINKPSDFKVCEGCGRVVRQEFSICPTCHAYRFLTNEESVVERAIQLASQEQRSKTLGNFDFD